MESQRSRLPTTHLVLGLLIGGLFACTSNDGPGTSTTTKTGGVVTHTGGVTDSGGSPNTGGKSATGGEMATGGNKATGGAPATGGVSVPADTGGSKATGGSSTGGISATGGAMATGGAGKGGSSPDAAIGGTGGIAMGTGGITMGTGGKASDGGVVPVGTGGTPSGTCQKGTVKAKEVLIMGESFYAMAPQYNQKRIEENAKKAGAIGANDSYRNVAISGQPMSVVVGEFDTGLQGGAVKVVIMDGGGIDCMSNSCDSCPGAFKTLLAKMATNGVQEVIYTRYPEPGNPPGSNATLKKNLDILMPKMQPVCEASTSPRCHWVDLRPVWVNGDTTDGLHPTQSGGDHVGDAIWAEMVKDCIAQ